LRHPHPERAIRATEFEVIAVDHGRLVITTAELDEQRPLLRPFFS